MKKNVILIEFLSLVVKGLRILYFPAFVRTATWWKLLLTVNLNSINLTVMIEDRYGCLKYFTECPAQQYDRYNGLKKDSLSSSKLKTLFSCIWLEEQSAKKLLSGCWPDKQSAKYCFQLADVDQNKYLSKLCNSQVHCNFPNYKERPKECGTVCVKYALSIKSLN